jgi:hypothetical protein
MEWITVPIVVVLALAVLIPPVALAVLFGTLVIHGLFWPVARVVARQTIDCPFSRRRARLEILGAEDSTQPLDVASCSVFENSRQVRCKKGCLDLVTLGAVASPLMPRFSLIDGGVAYRLQPNGADASVN